MPNLSNSSPVADEKLGKNSTTDLSIEERIELLQQARLYAQHARAANLLTSANRPLESNPIQSNTFEPNLHIRPCTSYVLSRTGHLETNVDRWFANADDGYDNDTATARLRRDGTILQPPVNMGHQRSTSILSSSFWYILTFLPLLYGQGNTWCSPTNYFMVASNVVYGLAQWLKTIACYIHAELVSRLDTDQILHNCFVVAIDILVGLHAIIILLVSYYQQQEIHY